jgi:hypothetical protein
MKNFVFCIVLVVFSIALTTTSCEKDSVEPFVGKWEMQFLHIIAYVDDELLGDTTIIYDPGDAWIEYREDKTGHTYIKGKEDYEFTWSLVGGKIEFKVMGQGTISMDYIVNKNAFTWSNSMNEGPYDLDPLKTYKEVWYVWAKRI